MRSLPHAHSHSQGVRIKGERGRASGQLAGRLLPNLTRLKLDECETDRLLLPIIAHNFKGLRVMHFGCMDAHRCEGAGLDMSPLAQLQRLQELSHVYDGYELNGVGAVLGACSQLHKLELPFLHDFFPSSPSLEELVVGKVVWSRPIKLDVGLLPRLKSLCVMTMFLYDSREVSVEALEQNVSMLSELPPAVKVEFGVSGECFLFESWGDDDGDIPPPQAFMASLRCLSNLSAVRELRTLVLSHVVFTPDLVDVLSMFEGLRVLVFGQQVDLSASEHAVLGAVQSLTSLAVLNFEFSLGSKGDIWGAMCFVQGRGMGGGSRGMLTLSVRLPDADAGERDCVQDLQRQFEACFPSERFVALVVGVVAGTV